MHCKLIHDTIRGKVEPPKGALAMKVRMTPELRKFFTLLTSAGGKARAAALTKAQRREIAKAGAKARADKYRTGELKYKTKKKAS